MQKIIREVDAKLGITQVTIVDERWYIKGDKAVPSVTWVAGHYPKGAAFFRWMASQGGYEQAEAVKIAAGAKGTKIHAAITDAIEGTEVRIDSKYVNTVTGQPEELTLEECDAILSFIRWREATPHQALLWDRTLFSDFHNVAGTIDYAYRLPGEDGNTIHLVDFKSGQDVYPEYELQVSAYKQLLIENILNGNVVISGLNVNKDITVHCEVLQVGYRRNKNLYKLTSFPDAFELFLAAKLIWQKEAGDQEPKKKDYPIVLSPALIIQKPKKVTKKKIKKAKQLSHETV